MGERRKVEFFPSAALEDRIERVKDTRAVPPLGSIEFDVTITPKGQRSPILFHIRSNHINCGVGWEKKLSEEQKLKLFNFILGQYRQYSEKDCGLFSAALCVSDIEVKGRKQSNIYVSFNTNEASAMHKDCAETNLTRTMLGVTQNKGRIRELYLMAGLNGTREHLSAQKLEDPVLPCGKCADMLEAYCLPGAQLYNLPANNGSFPVVLNDTAKTLGEVKKGEAWKIPVHEVLLAYRAIALDDRSAAKQEAGWVKLLSAPEKRAKPYNVQQLLRKSGKLDAKEKEALECARNAALVAQQRAEDGKESIAELEGMPTLSNINRYMVQCITQQYDLRREKDLPPAEKIRIAVVRLADGTFHDAMEVIGAGVNATMPAEVKAVQSSDDTYEKVTDIWVMEVNARDVIDGVMHTSPKEALERPYKRRPVKDDVRDVSNRPIKDSMNITFIPFNTGQLTQRVLEKMVYTFGPQPPEWHQPGIGHHEGPFEKIYASAFKGSAQMRAKNGDGGHGHGH